MHSQETQQTQLQDILVRLNALERQNRWMKRCGAAAALLLAIVAGLGFQAKGKKILTGDEVAVDVVRAKSVLVPSDRGLVRIDENGITITAPGQFTNGRTNVVSHESRIEIGMDHQWSQDNGLSPTPRIAAGRIGKDTADNTVTRAAVLSPEGVHSGEWHTNNPRHDGRTDRDLIDELRRR